MKMKTYEIGTQFKPVGKHTPICTVTDILHTYNSKGDLINIRYEASHTFCGQTVTQTNIVAATIARGIFNLKGE